MANRKNPTRRLLIWMGSIIGVLIVLLVIGKLTGLFGKGNKAEEVETAIAGRRTITQVVTASGKVQPETEVKISSDVSGEIIELRVKEGDAVRHGDLLVRIKPDFYMAQVEQAEAGVSQSLANLSQQKADMMRAELEFNRQKGLHERGVVSDSDFLTVKTQYDVARSAYDAADFAVQSAKARLRESKEQLAKTSIYSPMTGTISQLDVEPGERVVGTSQMAGTDMMRVAKLDLMEIEVDVNENDVINVSLGDSASIEIDAYPERKFKGIVTEIANSARIQGAGSQEQVTNFPVKIRVLGTENQDTGGQSSKMGLQNEEVPMPVLASAILRPGMSGTVDVYTETIEDVVAVPIQAVTVRDFTKIKNDSTMADDSEIKGKPKVAEEVVEDKNKPKEDEDLRKIVFVVRSGKVKVSEVETGISDDSHVQIRSGLLGQEEVVTGPFSIVSRTLEPGMAVKIKEEEKSKPSGALAATP